MAFELTEQIERHLVNDRVAWLTTVTPEGRPMPYPVWFVWDGSAIMIYSVNTGARLKHIEQNNTVSVNFNTDFDAEEYVVIWGRAERVEDAPPPSKFPGLLEKYQARMTEMGASPQWYDDNYGVLLRIVPERSKTIGG